MSTMHRIGKAAAVAQVWTGVINSVDSTPADNTFTVTIGGVSVSVAGVTDVAATATALRAALNASTHPFFTPITWSGSAGDIIGTADTAGVAFTAALTKTGSGTGTVTDFVVTTANAGKNSWKTPANWAGGVAPANGDDAYLRDLNEAILWDLDNSAVDLALLVVDLNVLQPIGLNRAVYQTGESSTNTDYNEPRDHYLKISAAVARIGGGKVSGQQTGSGRIKINFGDEPCACVVENSSKKPTETNLRTVRLLFNDAASTLLVREGYVAVAGDAPSETSTLLSATLAGGELDIHAGVTLTNWYQTGGSGNLHCAATLIQVQAGSLSTFGFGAYTTIELLGGTTTIKSTGAVTTANVHEGATLRHDAGGDITTLNLGGLLDLSARTTPLDVGTFNVTTKAARIKDPNNCLAVGVQFVAAEGVSLADLYESMSPGRTLEIAA